MLEHLGNILVLAPQRPPLEFISNLKEIMEKALYEDVSTILEKDFQVRQWKPILIPQNNVTSFVKKYMSLSEVMIRQVPHVTDKTYIIPIK